MTNKFKSAATATLLASGTAVAIFAFTGKVNSGNTGADVVSCARPATKGCVFKILLGLEDVDKTDIVKDRSSVEASLSRGLDGNCTVFFRWMGFG